MSTNPIIERLKAMKIHSGSQLAEHVQAPAVIYFFVQDANGNDDPRTELDYWENGKLSTEQFRPDATARRSISRMRTNCVAKAKLWAAQELQVKDWRRAAFPNCWLPAESIAKIQAEIAALKGEPE